MRLVGADVSGCFHFPKYLCQTEGACPPMREHGVIGSYCPLVTLNLMFCSINLLNLILIIHFNIIKLVETYISVYMSIEVGVSMLMMTGLIFFTKIFTKPLKNIGAWFYFKMCMTLNLIFTVKVNVVFSIVANLTTYRLNLLMSP